MEKNEKVISITVDESVQNIQISGLTTNSIDIDCKSDVDLTKFVEALESFLDEEKEVKSEYEYTGTDEKMKLVINCINEILNEFNSNLKQESPDEEVLQADEDLPF